MSENNIHPLQQARKKLGIKQKVLADLTGLSEPTIKRAERGELLSAYSVAQICEYFSQRFGHKVEPEDLGLRTPWVDGNREAPAQKVEEDRQAADRHQSSLEKIVYNNPFSPETLIVGGLAIASIVLARGHFSPKEVHCFYDGTDIALTPEFERMRKALINDLEERKAEGESKLPYNSGTYKLKEFDIGYREIINGKEVPVLRLKFGPTDYFTQMVTDLNVGNPVRERYARVASITEQPVPEFASILGINLNVITKDSYLLVTERSSRAFVAGGRLHTSVGENLLRPADAGPSNAPNPFRCAIRGAQEELGLTLNQEDVVFSTFTVIPDLCQYSLISTIKIQQTQAEIEKLWRFAIPSDKWENRRLLFYPHNPDSIAQFTVSTWDRWFNVALAAVILSLLDVGYSEKHIEAAFSHTRSRLSF